MGIIKQLINDKKEKIYPITKAEAVYIGETSVGNVLNDLRDQNTKIEFKTTGEIVKSLASGNVVTTTVKADGTIVAKTIDKNGKLLETKTTTVDEDGNINIIVE